jgi:DNA sulfur modification protein DndC
MIPLLEIRNFLAKTIDREDPNYRPEQYRMPVRRNFQKGLGPYWPRFRNEILVRLLGAQATIQEQKPDVQLITYQELVSIQTIWHRDFIYEYDVADVFEKVYGQRSGLDQVSEEVNKEHLLLREVCSGTESDFHLINNLLKAQRNRILLVNTRGLQKDIEKILDEYLYPTFTDVYRKDNN